MPNPIRSIWRQAEQLADQAPATRNRTVDFLRAASITVVVIGHWLVAAPHVEGGALVNGHMLALAPWTRWLTLVVQVMPIFFLVGGYSNAIAWQAARRKGVAYGPWLAARIQRLVAPVLPVVVVWIGIAAAATALGVPTEETGLATQLALVPTWFLAVYVMVGVLVPLTLAAWERFGFASFALLALAAAGIDALVLRAGLGWIGYVNYAFVWLAVHQLGHAWQAGAIRRPLVWAAAGGALLAALVGFGPYSLAMVGVPGEAFGNTSPPTFALLVFGVMWTGLVLAAEPALRRLLERRLAWTATVLVNGMIMTVFLWHMTAMLAVIGLAYSLGGVGLHAVPDTAQWWATRPLWMGVYAAALVPLMAGFLRFERPRRQTRVRSKRRLLTGASLTAAGLGLLSAKGIVGPGGAHVGPSLMPLVGSALAGFGPLRRLWYRLRGVPVLADAETRGVPVVADTASPADGEEER